MINHEPQEIHPNITYMDDDLEPDNFIGVEIYQWAIDNIYKGLGITKEMLESNSDLSIGCKHTKGRET